jgi:hypothetical protein
MCCLPSQVQYRRRFRYTGDVADHMFTITNFRPPLHRAITAGSLSKQFGYTLDAVSLKCLTGSIRLFPWESPSSGDRTLDWVKTARWWRWTVVFLCYRAEQCVMAVSSPSTWRRDLVHGRTDNNFTILVSCLCINHNPPTLAETMRVGLVLKARAGSSDASELCVTLHSEFVRNPSWAFRLIPFWMASV